MLNRAVQIEGGTFSGAFAAARSAATAAFAPPAASSPRGTPGPEASLNDRILVLARNVIGFTGLGLLCSLVTGGLLAWTLPLGYMLFCQYALLQAWRAPRTWPVRPRRHLEHRKRWPAARASAGSSSL